jgi:hypothetical protein
MRAVCGVQESPLTALLRREHEAMADFLVALAGFDRQRGREPLGHASLFAFLHTAQGLSNNAAFQRMSAARLLQRFPDLIEPLREGRLCLSSIGELAKVLTEENRAVVAPRFFGLSAREAREVVAELMPREAPPLRAVVTSVARAVPTPVPAFAQASKASHAPLELQPLNTDPASLLTSEGAPTHPARDDAPRDDVEPLTADLRRLHVTVSKQFLKKLDAARDGLSHAIPNASAEQVLEAALDLLLEKQAKARRQVKKPRTFAAPASTTAPTMGSAQPSTPTFSGPLHRRTGPREQIPAAVRGDVWERDQGRCSWPLDGAAPATRPTGWSSTRWRYGRTFVYPQ